MELSGEVLVKIVAIIGLVILECVNLMTAKVDGNILLTIGAIIGGIAGYELKGYIVKKEKEK